VVKYRFSNVYEGILAKKYPLPMHEFAEYEDHIRWVIHRSFKHYNSYDLANDIQLTDELTQEILARVCSCISTYSPLRTTFSSWTDGIIFNVIKEYFRKQARIRENEVRMFEHEEEENLAFMSDTYSPEKAILKAENIHIVRRAMDMLRSRWPDMFQILYYRSYHELKHTEIAKLMNMQVEQLHRKYYKATQRLRQCIEEIENQKLYR
jgi:RNA polymerase sigma factor (sigma-70 family)